MQNATSLLDELHESLMQKCSGKLSHGVFLAGQCTPETRQKIHSFGFDHPPYSPSLDPLTWILCLKLKKHLKGLKFLSDSKVINATDAWLEVSLSKFFLQGLEKLTIARSVNLRRE